MDSTQQHFIAAVSQLRQCGFFEAYAGQTDAQAAATLLEALRQQCAGDPWLQAHPEYSWDKQLLESFAEPATADTFKEIAVHDSTRVWAGDLEADVGDGNHVYEHIVTDYARLSMGHLHPTRIVEEWLSEEGPIMLSFEQEGQRFVTELAYYDDWIDGEVFTFLEEVMRSQGFPAAIYFEANTGQDVFLVRATEAEKVRMEQKLGWSFDGETSAEAED